MIKGIFIKCLEESASEFNRRCREVATWKDELSDARTTGERRHKRTGSLTDTKAFFVLGLQGAVNQEIS